MKSIIIKKFSQPFRGKISVPGSKSLTNRIFPLAVLSQEKIKIKGALESEDAEIMRNCLSQMGVIIKKGENTNEWNIEAGTFFENSSDEILHCGNSGTTIRFLTALCALRKGKTTLTGIERMKERPIGDLGNALEQLGTNIQYEENENFPPLTLFPSSLLSVSCDAFSGMRKTLKQVKLSGSLSSQFFTALFHISPKIGLEIIVENELVSKPYIEMTLQLMKQFGITIENRENNYQHFVIHQQKFSAPAEILVEGDASSATYPLAIGLITGGKVEIENLPKNSLQGDAKFTELVIDVMKGSAENNYQLQPLGEIDLEDIPDAALTAIALCAYANGYSKITGLSTLRHKECDRLFAMESNLKKMGIRVETTIDSIEIWGDAKKIHGAEIECFNDHRIAMSFAVLGTVVDDVKILDMDCVQKTYPTFWDDMLEWRKGE